MTAGSGEMPLVWKNPYAWQYRGGHNDFKALLWPHQKFGLLMHGWRLMNWLPRDICCLFLLIWSPLTLSGSILMGADAPWTSRGGNEVRVLTRETTSPTEEAATCLTAALLTPYHPSCNLVATTCLMSLLAALLTVLQALFIGFTFAILFAQLLRQELCLLGEEAGLKLLAWGKKKKKRPRNLYCTKATHNQDLVLRLWRWLLWACIMLNKPGYSTSPSAACLLPWPQFL